jgi:uncharacterized lipoprotein YddW (UPF0748 family)
MVRVFLGAVAAALVVCPAACAFHPETSDPVRAAQPRSPMAEVRGTWITTTANDAIATPQNTATTMRRLREIGLNTVYVETWKNGYTQFPSEVLARTIGVDRRPALVKMDPSDPDRPVEFRDLLEETLIEAHRQGLIYIAWFEYGFMAAHKDTDNHLRRMYPHWLSRDIHGNEVAKNGFVWMNPLHPEARRFLLEIVLEAADKYDLDGVQLDDRIVWPYYDMGYDEYTVQAYKRDHQGAPPPTNPRDPGWMRWRADHVNEFSKQFTQHIRGRHPGLLLSLSPAVYPWCWENYLLEWPRWAAWTRADAYQGAPGWIGRQETPRWDEFIPQNYRFSYEAFERTWLDQVRHMKELGADRQRDLIAGIRLVGEGADSTWEQLRQSMDLVRTLGNGGHVHWFSRGVLDIFPDQLTEYYRTVGPARNPHFPDRWRRPSVPLSIAPDQVRAPDGQRRWQASGVEPGRYRVIVHDGRRWAYHGKPVVVTADDPTVTCTVPADISKVELIVDRRGEKASLKR